MSPAKSGGPPLETDPGMAAIASLSPLNKSWSSPASTVRMVSQVLFQLLYKSVLHTPSGTFLLLFFFFLFKILSLFIYFERDRERAQAGERQRERGRQRIQSRLCADSREPDAGLKLMNYEIMT